MDFGEILKKSFNNVKKYRYLWGLGILSALAGGISNMPNSFGNSFNFKTDPMDSGWKSSVNTDWMSNHTSLIIISSLVCLALLILFIYIALRAEAGLINSVNKIEKNQPFKNFKESWKSADGFAGNLFILGLFSCLIVLLWVAIMIGLPALLMVWLQTLIMYIFGGIIILTGVIGLIFLALALTPTLEYAKRKIVLKKMNSFDALIEGWARTRRNPGSSALALLLYMVVSGLAGLIILTGIGLIGIILFEIGTAVYATLGIASTIAYGITLGIPLFAIMIMLSGIIQAYFSSFWTLVYLDLKK